MKRRARIHKYSVDGGYGFLLEEDGMRHFFHVTNCNFIPKPGLLVTFDVGEGRRGPAAINVTLLEAVNS